MIRYVDVAIEQKYLTDEYIKREGSLQHPWTSFSLYVTIHLSCPLYDSVMTIVEMDHN